MRLKLIRLGSIITLINGIYAILVGLFFVFASRFLISSYFENFPEVWDILVKKWISDISQYFLIMIYTGLLIITLGIFIIYLSAFILSKRDKLAWVVLFLGGIIGWGGMFIVNIFAKSFIVLTISFIGWASFIIGMVIPLKYYLKKEYPTF